MHRILPLFAMLLVAASVQAQDAIRIVGSSTVFPFATAVAERFGRTTDYRTPIIESTGSGGGFKLFCAGAGLDTPSITNASRRMKASEVATCSRNGVAAIVEVKVGFDGIVVANSKAAPRFDLTKKELFLALAKRVPIDGKLVENPYENWHDIDPDLPDEKIEVLGPPPTSGTRDAFVELAMEGGAEAIPMLAALRSRDKASFQSVAHAVREDGAYIEAGENDNLIVSKLEANPTALGIFVYSFLDQNADRIQGSRVGGIEPTFENISDGTYGISRSLYFYVKKAHVGTVAGILQYMDEFTSEAAAGEDGYLADKGLIPLGDDERRAVRAGALGLSELALE